MTALAQQQQQQSSAAVSLPKFEKCFGAKFQRIVSSRSWTTTPPLHAQAMVTRMSMPNPSSSCQIMRGALLSQPFRAPRPLSKLASLRPSPPGPSTSAASASTPPAFLTPPVTVHAQSALSQPPIASGPTVAETKQQTGTATWNEAWDRELLDRSRAGVSIEELAGNRVLCI